MLFKRMTGAAKFFPLSQVFGLMLFGIMAAVAAFTHPSLLAMGGAAVIILLAVAVWEWGSFHGG